MARGGSAAHRTARAAALAGCCCISTAAAISGFRRRWYDYRILDDAQRDLYAQLVEEIDGDSDGGMGVIERKGLFCALYSDRGAISG